MAENVLQTLQQLVQDVIAPDVRELKVRVAANHESLTEKIDSVAKRFDSKIDSLAERLDSRIDSLTERLDSKMDAQFQALMAAISESKAQNELASYKLISALAERVAVLEARRAS